MRVLILTYGSRGDVQPYVALGRGLRSAGHEVTLSAPARFADFVTSHGLGFGALSGEILDLLATDEGRAFLDSADSPAKIATQLPELIRRLSPLQDRLLRDCWDIAQQTRPDIILFHPKTYGGPHIAERLGIPAVLTLPVPYLVPTAEEPNTIFPDLHLGAGYNRFTYYVVLALLGLWSIWFETGLRHAIGLPRQGLMDRVRIAPGRAIPTLHAVSPHVVARPSDWPANAHMTGYWFLDEGADWTPPAALETFLAAGPPPVYVGFGSMVGHRSAQLGRIVVEALARAGLRGVIATGWGGLSLPPDLPDSIFALEQAPHDWLFPRMAALVHHGGAGTTAAGLRCGRPAVIVPFFGDQPYWGKRIAALGAGAPPLPQRSLTAPALAEALVKITRSNEIRHNAAALSQKIRAENGVAEAVRIIEGYAAARTGSNA